MSRIFISHRTTDADVADMLKDFFVATGIDRSDIFCSSLPGNDVKEIISSEVKIALKDSAVNIVILSEEYYKSAYCLNESGIIWFEDDVFTIVIALPEILPENMIGFLNNDYKLRRLDNEEDIAFIYDNITAAVKVKKYSYEVVTKESKKLKNRYSEWIKNRKPVQMVKESSKLSESSECIDITTDDERIVLYYMLSHGVRKVSQEDIEKWLTEEEIYGVNIENSFDLLSAIGNSSVNGKVLGLDVKVFKELSRHSEDWLIELNCYVEKHYKPSELKFKKMWKLGQFDDSDMLFIAYIIDEIVITFGELWEEKEQVDNIKHWELKNDLKEILSIDYGKCLRKFIANNFVYESCWDDFGNALEHTLHKSIKEFLLSDNFIGKEEFKEELNINKEIYKLPF